MKGYYNNPEATSAALKDGWLYTGDMCRQDEDGFLFLVDRKKDLVISGGENIFPVEIEDFLQAHADIKDVAVIGLPDKRLGEVAVAIIEIKAGRRLTEDQVLEFCEALPRYKRPRRIFFDKVPRNPTGKIEKPKLREQFPPALSNRGDRTTSLMSPTATVAELESSMSSASVGFCFPH